MTIRLRQLSTAMLLLAIFGAAAAQDEGAEEAEPRRCINTGSILKTRIIDDSNVVFIMRRDEIYLNNLSSRCHGLSRAGRFSYRIQTRSLCELETITVIESGTLGQPLGRTCSLGMFKPVTMDALLTRFAPVIRQRQAEKMEAPSIEEIGAEDDEDQPDQED